MALTRRMTRTVLAGAALGGLLLSQQACTAAGDGGAPATTGSGPAATPGTTGTTPAAAEGGSGGEQTSAASQKEILAGERQVLIHLAEEDKDLSATFEGPITTGPGTDDGAKFRLVPSGKAYLIETLRPVEFEGRFCVVVKTGGERASLSTADCKAGDTTLFLITPTGDKDEKGRATYHLKNDKHGFVQWSDNDQSLYVQQVGDAAVQGSFSFVDRGAA